MIQEPPVWQELAGQPEAVHQLSEAVRHRENGVHHAWLFTGPPGSGRSNLAQAFAAALLCQNQGCGDCQSCRMVMGGGHPDVTVLATERVVISIDEVRALVATSYVGSSLGKYRVLIIEDADRMAERSSNVLLKALEEPPSNTIWILCAPSEADLLPTIRSRVRRIALKVPSVQDVANLLVARDGVAPELALQVAAESQSHIGMARRLATDSEARARRKETLVSALNIRGISSAMFAAERWLDIAKKDADALTTERDAQERENMLRTMGLEPGAAIPTGLRSEVRALEEAQKRRATRSLRDGIDRILVDLLSLYRDALTIQLGAAVPLVNAELSDQIRELASESTSAVTLNRLDAIAQTRVRIDSNVKDLIALEALAAVLRRKN
ncbi:MAG: DNA polymerase III subunit delta' [Micrococcales bacterium]